MSYYRYEFQRDYYTHPNHCYGHQGYGRPMRGQPLRSYEEPRRHEYVRYSNHSALGGMGNPFYDSDSITIDLRFHKRDNDSCTPTGMGNRMGGAMRGARSRVNAGQDRVGGWGQAMDDRFDRFSGDLRQRMGQRMASGRGGRGGGRGMIGFIPRTVLDVMPESTSAMMVL